MFKTIKPTKEQVREYMGRRQAEHKPPPPQEEIRRQLGWNVIDIDRDVQGRHRH
jgi:hypothetical protein